MLESKYGISDNKALFLIDLPINLSNIIDTINARINHVKSAGVRTIVELLAEFFGKLDVPV